jgi:hypothetical protein
MEKFSKSVNCPASEDLVNFQNKALDSLNLERIANHISVCEFCASESDLYMHFPESDVFMIQEKIPQPLRELAEALLGNKSTDFRLLNKLLCDNESLILKQA